MNKWNSYEAHSVRNFESECSLRLRSGELLFPTGLKEQTEWKAEIGDGVQDFCKEALFPKCSFFGRMKGNGLNKL